MINLTHNSEFQEIAETALSDYLQWFDDEPQNQNLIDEINTALQSGDYLHCDALEDALRSWADNLQGIIDSTTNLDDVADAARQLTLINAYFAN